MTLNTRAPYVAIATDEIIEALDDAVKNGLLESINVDSSYPIGRKGRKKNLLGSSLRHIK